MIDLSEILALNVEQLRNTFADDGCHRLDPLNRIAALVSPQGFVDIISNSNLSLSILLHGAGTGDEAPKLMLPVNATLRSLHGELGLEAAVSQFSDDARWTIDLSIDGENLRYHPT